MKTLITIILLLFINVMHSQVGIGTTNPEGALDISSSTMGVVVPRVTSIEDAMGTSGNDPVNGTILFDQSRNKICFRVSDTWVCNGVDASGNATTEVIRPLETDNSTYVKASNTSSGDYYGANAVISDNGLYIVIGAIRERSSAIGINGDQSNNDFFAAGAAYVYFYDGTNWAQQAYIKASNTAVNDNFGHSVSINNDGSRIAISAVGESSNATGSNGNQADNSISASGAVYIFSRSGITWTQEAYLKASNPGVNDRFGDDISISGDGSRLVVSASTEDSNATGINGNQADDSAINSGAAYVFSRTGINWTQEAYFKASNTEENDRFGIAVSMSGDGSRIAISAISEDSNATGINGNQADNSASLSGAVYVYSRSGITWSQEAYIKASNTDVQDNFGVSISISNDGSRLVIGANREDSNATSVNGVQTNNISTDSGAAYLFERTGTTWNQAAYIKASNSESNDSFGQSVAISGDGTSLIIASPGESSDARGINGNQNNNNSPNSGAAFVFTDIASVWSQTSYIKASNADTGDLFGISAAINNDGSRILLGALSESSNATGINGNQDNNSFSTSGAGYIIEN